MKKTLFIAGLLVIFAGVSVYAQPAPKPESALNINGIWLGSITLPGGGLRVVFNVKKDASGKLSATMDSPDQGAKGIPVSKVTVNGENVLFEVAVASGVFNGKMEKDGALHGTWKQNGMDFPLVLKRVKAVKKPPRPQEPKPPFPYRSEEVTIRNAGDSITLAGTLTIPQGKGPFPAVLLVTGSGPENRNEEVFGHKPFLVLADYLTRRGIAVLRCDDRGVGKSGGNFATATEKDFVDDALAEVAYLKGRKEVDPRAVGLIGHSEGGIIAPRAAVRSKDVSFIVLLEGPGVPGERIILSQTELILKANGADEASVKHELETSRKAFAILKAERNNAVAAKKLKAWLESRVPGLDKMSVEKRNAVEKGIAVQVRRMTSPWFRGFLTFDPASVLVKVKCPVLAIGASKDLQVPADENLAAIKKALKEGGNKDFTIKKFEGLNHLLQPAKTGSPSEYAKIATTMSPDVLKVVGDWILERFHPGKPFGKSPKAARG